MNSSTLIPRSYILVAPSTFPLMLYRLLKYVYQSFRTFLCSSERSSHSGRHSSGFKEDCARAREASFPAKTLEGQRGAYRSFKGQVTNPCRSLLARKPCCQSHRRQCPYAQRQHPRQAVYCLDTYLDGHISRVVGVRAYPPSVLRLHGKS